LTPVVKCCDPTWEGLSRMARTHDVSITGHVLTKRYTSWSRNEHRVEWATLQTVSAATHDLVPAPLHADLEADPPAVSMTLLPGRPLEGSLSTAEFDGLEVALRELWSVRADGLPQLAPASTADLARLQGLLASWEGSGIVGEARALAHEWLCGPQAEQLLVPCPETGVGHGDPNLSNYLWDGSRVRIVDFEDAGRSDPALELANLVEHISARETDWTDFVRRFSIDPARFAAARCLWATFWLTLLRPGGRSSDRNPPGTAESQAERLMTLLANCSP
jgi:aminoglycoside phosphotransferase (APT) family kinase protein